MVLEAALLVFRHGQRSPYPWPGGDSAAGPSQWTTRPMPSISAWNMTDEAFNNQWLSPHGKLLLNHMGAWFGQYFQDVNSCDDNQVVLVADGSSFRDIQSAQNFAAGFFPASCSAIRAAEVIATTESTFPLLYPLANDHADTGCDGPSEEQLELTYGGDVQALTSAYRPLIDRVGQLIGCCSPTVCAQYGLGRVNCSLSSLPTSFAGHYWRYYNGPLAVAAYFSDAFMLQAVSGLEPYAWGVRATWHPPPPLKSATWHSKQLTCQAAHSCRSPTHLACACQELSQAELTQLYRLHQRVMWLGSSIASARAYASHALAYLLTTLESIKLNATNGGGASLLPPAVGGAPHRPRVLAVFGHDFNLLYLRQLLRVHWVTRSFDFDTATTGSSLALELHRFDHHGPARTDGGTTTSGASADATSWRVIGRLTAASIGQQRNATPLVPPHAPPSIATVLDMPYEQFKSLVLTAINTSCILDPLRTSIVAMQQVQEAVRPTPTTAAEVPPGSVTIPAAAAVGGCMGLLLVGCVCGVLLRMMLVQRTAPRKRMLEMTAVDGPAVSDDQPRV